MNTRNKLIIIATVPGLLILAIVITLAVRDMGAQHRYIAEELSRFIENNEVDATDTDEVERQVVVLGGQILKEQLLKSTVPGIIVLAILMVAGALFFTGRILKELQALVSSVKTLASPQASLSFRIEIDEFKEFKTLVMGLNTMLDRNERAFIQIRDMVTSFNELSTTLKQSSEINVVEAGILTDNADHVSQAIAEIKSAAFEITANVQQSNQDITSINEEGQAVNTQITALNAQLENLKSASDSNSRGVADLAEKVNGISSILLTIQGIAEQTNLLALNAAIEAARAGEQGRGFAVVADEVRSLAAKTHQSTREISDLIENLNAGAAHTVSTMQSSSEAAESLTVSLAHSNRRILDLFQRVSSVNDLNIVIAAASEEQTTVIDQTNQNMADLTSSAKKTKIAAHDTSEEIAVVFESMEKLQYLVKTVKFG